jgi:hypothetical protein
MNITLHDDLKVYLKEKAHDTITLKLIHSDYSSSNTESKTPEVTYHPPKNVEDFDVFTVDDISVFIDKTAKSNDDHLEFVLENLFGIRACHAKGLDLDNLKVM